MVKIKVADTEICPLLTAMVGKKKANCLKNKNGGKMANIAAVTSKQNQTAKDSKALSSHTEMYKLSMFLSGFTFT